MDTTLETKKRIYHELRLAVILNAYQKLSGEDKAIVDGAISDLLRHVENLNKARQNKAKLRFSQESALELLACIGVNLSGKVWPEPEE